MSAHLPLDADSLLKRFHAQEADGPLLSGAAAFAALWRRSTWLRPLGLAAHHPAALWILERMYRVFLRARPHLQAVMAVFQSRSER
jgi:hypothetical protein